MISVIRYTNHQKADWNAFVRRSKNGVFLFDRDYMEYHSNRFVDLSLMVYEKGDLLALFPANIAGDTLNSHGGLTFGGFVSDANMTAPRMLRAFDGLRDFVSKEGIRKIMYKSVPHIYHAMPAEEDRYALFLAGARLYRRDITSTIALHEKPRFQELRLRRIRKAQSAAVAVRQTTDFVRYWTILEGNLAARHETRPVHSLEEIQYLHELFPDNIRLFAAYQGDKMLAGVVIYESTSVAHAQYIAGSNEAREIGALDAVFSHLISDYYRDKKYFDFGISTEQEGLYLNEGLISFKEGFGARGIVHDFYEMSV